VRNALRIRGCCRLSSASIHRFRLLRATIWALAALPTLYGHRVCRRRGGRSVVPGLTPLAAQPPGPWGSSRGSGRSSWTARRSPRRGPPARLRRGGRRRDDRDSNRSSRSFTTTAVSRSRLRRSDPVLRTGWPVGRVLSPASRGATIHLRVPLPTPSSGLPAHSGGPPSNVRAPRASTGLLDLAPSGVCRAGRVAPVAGGLLHRRFTLTPLRRSGEGRSVLCGTVPRVAPGGCYPPLCPVEPGPSSGSHLHAVARPAHPRLKDSGGSGPARRRTTSRSVAPPRRAPRSPRARRRRWRRGRGASRC